MACDEKDKYAQILEAGAPDVAAQVAALASSFASATPATPPPPPKKKASECKVNPQALDFSDAKMLENEVRRKLSKDKGTLTAADLAQVHSLNLTIAPGATLDQIDPCLLPLFSGIKDLFLPQGDYDDLSPIGGLSNLVSLRAAHSKVTELHSLEKLNHLDRLDISHTSINDDSLKSIAGLTNLTELMLDEDDITDLSALSNMKKLERLSIKKTGVKNLQPLRDLKKLRFLYIEGTPIDDITPVQPLMGMGMKLVTTGS
jgi:internalin A